MRNIYTTAIILIFCCTIFLSSCTEGHTHAWTASIEKAPTCTEEGILLRTCPCGATERQSISPKGHSAPVEKTVIEAGCVTEGRIERVCSDCGYVFDTITVPAVGHEPKAATVIKEPNCTETGLSSVICSRCGISLGDVEIPALGHSESFEIRRVKDPTCDTVGTDSVRCSVCHQELSTIAVPALGHLWPDSYITITESTCSAHGQGLQTCLRDNSHERIIELAYAPHIFTGESYIKSESTCSERGVIATPCINCGYENISYMDLKPHNMLWRWKLDELGNPMTPTETTPGWRVWECSECHYIYEEEVLEN